ncbi:hypothetical protein BDZ89DRAFT_1080404, partial [Hymenopellis radicata]
MSDTVLPLELLQVIFETAITLSESVSVTINLIGVCKATKEWIEPSLYHTVAILNSETASKFCSSIQARRERDLSNSFLATHVKELTLNCDIDDALLSPILEACTNIQGLYVTRQTREPKAHTCIDAVERAISSLRPKRIALIDGVNLAHFHAALQHATHIWWDTENSDSTVCCRIPFLEDARALHDVFPSLTHIMIPMTSSHYSSAASNRGDFLHITSAICEIAMSSCPALKVLVILPYPYLVNTLAVHKHWKADWVREVRDPRCVRLLPGTDSNDPHVGFVGGDLPPSVIPRLPRTDKELWQFAEREVALRKSEGLSIPPEYMVQSTRDCVV